MQDVPDLDARREQLAAAMKAARRWYPGYERDIASLPERVLDDLLRYYAGAIHVG